MGETLYLGLEVPPHLTKKVVHSPFIKILPKPSTDPAICSAFANFEAYTHLIFTSRNAVSIFFELSRSFSIKAEEISLKTVICVGQRTAAKLQENQIMASIVAKEETAEGILKELNGPELKGSHFFLPKSSLARPIICDWLSSQGISHTSCSIYETIPNLQLPLPDLTFFDEIIFTSPSTVDAFLLAYSALPLEKKLTSIGPVTKEYLLSKIHSDKPQAL